MRLHIYVKTHSIQRRVALASSIRIRGFAVCVFFLAFGSEHGNGRLSEYQPES